MLIPVIQPAFGSELCALICELERLRTLGDSTRADSPLLDDLRKLFFICESVASARIEGNRTTVAQYVDAVRTKSRDLVEREPYREITNLFETLRWIEENVGEWKVTEAFIRELHKRAVDNLNAFDGEGDLTPGRYRKEPVVILNARHTPPDPCAVPELMRELVDWLDERVAPQFELIRIAIAHWRLVGIHPFRNGNGRVARLLSYALLVKCGFIARGIILNPNAICCRRRSEYYQRLADADLAFQAVMDSEREAPAERGLEAWALFLLSGLKQELESTVRLMNRSFIVEEIVAPALEKARQYERLLPMELKIALFMLRRSSARFGDVVGALKRGVPETALRRVWRALRDKEIIVPLRENGRIYRFAVGSFLYPFVIDRLDATALTMEPLH